MTSACFVHMVPPYFAAGAGAEMRRSLGTAVLWGAFGVTLFGIFLTPVFFYVVDWLTNRRGRPERGANRGDPGRPGLGDAGRVPCEQRGSRIRKP